MAGAAGAGPDGEQCLELGEDGVEGQAGAGTFGSYRSWVQNAVGFHNPAMVFDLRRRGLAASGHAARSYWLISPARTLRRRILAVVRPAISAVVMSPSGGSRSRARCGRCWLQGPAYSSRTAHRCRGPAISIRSVTSALTVRTQRSAYAFARGLRGGILTTSIPALASTASKAPVNCPARSPIRNRNWLAGSPRSISRFRACRTVHAPSGSAVTPRTCT